MLNFAQCLIKPEFVIGLHGGDKYIDALQTILQQVYNMPFRLITLTQDSTIENVSLIPNSENKIKEKAIGVISNKFFSKITSIPFAIFLCFDISQGNLLDNTLITSIYKPIEQIQMKHPKKALIILLLSNNLIQKESDTSSFIRSIRSRIILEKKYMIHIKYEIKPNNEKIHNKMIKLELNKIAFNYYKHKKQIYENIRRKNNIPQETQAKISIKLAYISLLFQNEKAASSFYKEAYEIVMNKPLKSTDSIETKRHSFIEQRNASDWLLVNIFGTLKMDNETKKLALLNHLNQFDYELYFGKGVNDKKNTEVDQTIIAMSYYWRICFEDYFSSLLDIEEYSDFKAFNLINSIMRLITYLKNNNELLMKTNIDIESINEKESVYIEKIPMYYSIKEDNANEFNSDMILKIFYRKFIIKFNMTLKGLSYELLNKTNKLFQLNDQWTHCQFSLKILASTCDELEDTDKEKLYSSIISNANIELFPIVYIEYLQKYNEVLLRMTPLNANQIIFNLIKISEFRDLTVFEYETIKNILSEKMTTMQSLIFQVNSVNRLIQPSYTFSSYAPSICQLITFTLTINLNIDDLIKFKVKSIILQFSHLTRTKKIMYTEDQSPVFSKNLPLVISYEIFIQPSDSNLFLSNVQLETQNGMIFLISIKEDVSKSLKTITEQDLKTHVALNYPLNYIVGLNEYHLFNFTIEKKNDNITFDEIDAVFYFRDTNTIVPSHQFIKCLYGIDNISTNKLTIVHKESLNDIKGIDFILKFLSKLKEEPYRLSFEIKIKISHIGLKSDYFLYEEKGVLNIKVKDAFECFHDIKSSFVMKDDTITVYPAKHKIQNYISFKNNLDFPLSIKAIKLIPLNQSIKLSSQYNHLIEKIDSLMPLSEFIYQINIESEIETNSIGKIEIYWETNELSNYNASKINIDTFNLPSIAIKLLDVTIDIKVDNDQMMKVKLNNNTEFPCQTVLMIETNVNNTSTIATGKTLDKIMISPCSSSESLFGLVPIYDKSLIELPQIIIKVFKFGKILKNQKELYSLIVQHDPIISN